MPIFKGGNLEAKYFRGITLNNIISKIYSKLLVNRLTKWSDKHQKFIDNQFGFQKGKSTVDCIFIIHALILKTLASKKKLYVAFLDWEKCLLEFTEHFYGKKFFQKVLAQNLFKLLELCTHLSNHSFDTNMQPQILYIYWGKAGRSIE